MDIEDKCIAEFELITNNKYDRSNLIYVSVVEDMIAYRTSQKGNEGLNSLSLGGVNESYRSDYPDNVMRILKALKKRVQIL
ncbi:MAG: hypothetical protein AB9856_20855 [Cellulosilyticaceae bacterium]